MDFWIGPRLRGEASDAVPGKMIYQQDSQKSFAEIDQSLRESAARHKFGVIAVHDLQEMLRNKGVELERAAVVYEVCNPQQAKRVLDSDGAMSAALPCRISVFDSPEGVRRLVTILPTAMMGMFGKGDTAAVAKDVEDVVLSMIRESA